MSAGTLAGLPRIAGDIMSRTSHLLAVSLTFVLIGAAPAAAQHVVTSTAATGAGTLHQAIQDAASGDTITFDVPLPAVVPLPDEGAVIGGHPAYPLSKSLTIVGPGSQLTIQPARGLVVTSGHTVTFSNVRLTYSGAATHAFLQVQASAALHLARVLVQDVTGVEIVLSNQSLGTVSISESTFSGNTGFAILDTSSAMHVDRSSIVDNDCHDSAVRGFSTLLITNSTLSGNSGRQIWVQSGTTRIVSSTIVGTGNAAAVRFLGLSAHLELLNTIVTGNVPLEGSAARLLSHGHNMSSGGGSLLTHSTDRPNTDPELGPLADNGGPTLTHRPLTGGPAIDTGTCASLDGVLAIDQRGTSRPQGPQCDIGAVEVLPTLSVIFEAVAPLATQVSVDAVLQSIAELDLAHLDAPVSSRATQASVNAVQLSLAPVANLDLPVSSRATQASVDAVQSAVAALDLAPIESALAALATQASLDALAASMPPDAHDALESAFAGVAAEVVSSRASIDALTRYAIERALSDNIRTITYQLPASAGGLLETVREIVEQAIVGMQAIGVDTSRGWAALQKGDEAYAAGAYRLAYEEFVAAYRSLLEERVAMPGGGGGA